MLHTLAVTAIGLLAITSAQAQTATALKKVPNDWAKIERYAASNDSIIQSPNNGRRVVFLGNSITEFWRRDRAQFFTSHGYIGRGIGGQTSYQFLVRFRQDVLNLNPAVVVINAGTNDVAENTNRYVEDRTVANITTLVELAKLHHIKVILTSVLPASQFGWNKDITDCAEKIASLNARIKALAEQKGCGYVDYYSAMVSGKERSLNPAYTADGVHPNPDGYAVMEPLIVQAINKALGSK